MGMWCNRNKGYRKLPNVRNQLENSFFLLSNASNPESIGPAVAEISRFEYWAEEVKILYTSDWIEYVKIYLLNRDP